MITRLSVRRTSTVASSSRALSPHHDGHLLSFAGSSSAGLAPPPLPSSSRPSAFARPSLSSPLPPSLTRLTAPPPIPSDLPPISSLQPPPINPRPPERDLQQPTALPPPLASQPNSRSSPSPFPLPFDASPGFEKPITTPPLSTWQPEPVPEHSTFEELLESARAQQGRRAYQARPKQDIPGMHNRRFKANIVSASGRKLKSTDLQELGIRVAVIGALKREFGALEKVAFEQDPNLFVFPPFPSPDFSFTVLHPHSIPPNHFFSDGKEGYRIRGLLSTSLSSPPVGGPSLSDIFQAVAHHPSQTLRDIPSPTVLNQQTVFPNPEEDHVVSGSEFYIEVVQDTDWNPSYVLDPNATFQTQYETHEWQTEECLPDRRMFELETLLWEQGLGKFDGFAGGLRDAQDAMSRRLGRRIGDVDEKPIEVKALPRAVDVQTSLPGRQANVRGPFGASPPVLPTPRLKRVGGLLGDKIAYASTDASADWRPFGAPPSSAADAPPPLPSQKVAPHLRLPPRDFSLSASKEPLLRLEPRRLRPATSLPASVLAKPESAVLEGVAEEEDGSSELQAFSEDVSAIGDASFEGETSVVDGEVSSSQIDAEAPSSLSASTGDDSSLPISPVEDGHAQQTEIEDDAKVSDK